MGQYRIGLACLNGHAVNSAADTSPELNAKFCPKCGEPSIDRCSKCKEYIRGYYYAEGIVSLRKWKIPSHCHECGTSYPWTQRRSEALVETIDELDGLSDDERERLKKSIPDILVETPKSETAILRFKKTASKVGKVGGKALMNVLSKVVADAVKASLGI